MTVVLRQQMTLEVEIDSLSDTIEKLLQSNPIYKNIRVEPDRREFSVTARLNILFLTTQMNIQLSGEETRTIVTVQTTSPTYILADVGNI